MNAYEFGAQLGQLEKEAVNWYAAGKGVNKAVNAAKQTAQRMTQQGAQAVRRQAMGAADDAAGAATAARRGANRPAAVKAYTRATAQGASPMDAARRAVTAQGQALYHGTPGRLAGQAVDAVGALGQGTMNTMRRGLNKADDFVQGVMGGSPRAAGQRFGDTTVGRTQAMAKQIPEYLGGGTSAMTNARNPLNLAVGAGTGAAGLHYGSQMLGGGSEPSAANINTQQLNTQLAQGQHMEAAPPGGGEGGGLMGMWNSLPIEARYAIGAGVPLALAGAFMGGRGNAGLGGAMGALGLGAAGLGAAGAGMFGDGARRMVGQGANALYGMAGGGGGNPMDQINALSKLSPEFGTTMLMGRDPNMNSEQGRQMYDFLTHNRNIIEQLMPQLQNASTTGVKQSSALSFGEKLAGRCWKGYEPVPGKKPYSNDSCRPVGSKKKKDKEKKAVSSAARGKTDMSATPSSRGSSKLVDDKQRETTSPTPTDATNSKQTSEKISALFNKMDLVPPKSVKAKKPAAKLEKKKQGDK